MTKKLCAFLDFYFNLTYHEISLRFCVSVEDTVVVTCGSSGWVLAVSHHLSQGSRGVAEKFVIGLKGDGKTSKEKGYAGTDILLPC